MVTHGHTLCTVEQFNEVAKAIAECAFITSELPVIVSLEMHCSPKQQRQLASMLTVHLGDAILTVGAYIYTCLSSLARHLQREGTAHLPRQ